MGDLTQANAPLSRHSARVGVPAKAEIAPATTPSAPATTPSAPTKTEGAAPKPKKKPSERWAKVKRWILGILVIALAAGGYYAWQQLRNPGLPPGIASGNGRIEATEIDVDAKIAGRIKKILVDEGDFIKAGQVLVKMDIATLEAQRDEAEARLEQARTNVNTARSVLTQREAEKVAAIATVVEREAQVDGARRHFERSKQLAPNWVPQQRLDDDNARHEGAKAARDAAKAVVAAADAAINSAKSQIADAEAAVKAAQATIARIQADIDDSTLVSPRDGRVQHKVAQEGEILPAGGRVLNLVDLADVYMTFFLPTAYSGKVSIGNETRIVLDALPQYVIPARVTFVADVAQFTPKTVETQEERLKLTFRIKTNIPEALLRKYIKDVKTGLPGRAYVRADPQAEWPASVQGALLE